jgi:hypothetical protein
MGWKRWLRGSALHRAVHAGPNGSTFVSPHPRRRAAPRAHPHNRTVS